MYMEHSHIHVSLTRHLRLVLSGYSRTPGSEDTMTLALRIKIRRQTGQDTHDLV